VDPGWKATGKRDRAAGSPVDPVARNLPLLDNQYRVSEINSIDNAIYVKGEFSCLKLDWLVDTGCSISIVSEKVYNEIPMVKRPTLEEQEMDLQAANGDNLRVLGKTQMRFKVGSHEYKHPIIVAELTNDGILGMDFLRTYGGSIDLKSNKIILDGQEVPTQVALDGRKCYRVTLAAKTMVPAGHRVLVSGKVKTGVLSTKTDWMVESLSKPPGGKCLLVGRSLVSGGSGRVTVEMFNPTDEDVFLNRGTQTALVHPVEMEGELGDGKTPTKENQDREYVRKISADVSLPEELETLIEGVQCPLSTKEKRQLQNVLLRNKDVFQLKGEPLGKTDLVQHEIKTEGQPIRQPPRRYPLGLRSEGEKQVRDMLDQEVIEPSASPWSSPVVLVKKKDDSYRFCVDYRKLNNVTIKDSYPLPRIDDTLDSLAGAEYFTTLDLASGYWQVGLSEDAKAKTAFSTNQGLYQFKVLPFGLCNAPSTFERLMERVLHGLQWQILLVYLDDIIIFSKTSQQHLERLDSVFQRLKEAGLKLKPKKCHLFQREVGYLGHIVSAEGISTDPEKIEAIQNWPIPQDASDIRSGLGLFSYYRRFIKDYSKTARPLTKLTEKDAEFVWEEPQQQAWKQLKDAMTRAPILAYPDPDQDFILDTDASGFGIGAVLSQIQGGKERVIAYGSRTLSKEERRYCVTRRELLAVVYFLKHYRHYLFGRKFLLRTDHGALKYLLNFKDPQGQMARWLQVLGTYDFEVVHRAGRSHNNADAMSRGPCKQCRRENVCVITRAQKKKTEGISVNIPNSPPPVVGSGITSDPEPVVEKAKPKKRTQFSNWLGNPQIQPDKIRLEQRKDASLGLIIQSKLENVKPTWNQVSAHSTEYKSYWAQWESLVIDDDGLLCRELVTGEKNHRFQVLVPKSMINAVLEVVHDSVTGGHMGYRRTVARVRTQFFWYRQRESVQLWCKSCVKCAARKMGGVRKHKAALKKHVTGEPFSRIGIDLSGPYNVTSNGNKYILVVSCYFTKYVEAYAIKDMEAKTVADVLVNEFISRLGVPMVIHSDQGRNFESALFKQVCHLLGIKKTRTTAFHPSGNGLVERFNRTLNEMICTSVGENPNTWDQRLHLLTMAYRSTPHESTGFSPNFMVYGRELYMPLDVMMGQPESSEDQNELEYVQKLRERLEDAYEIAREHLQENANRQKRYYDVKAHEEPYATGDLVWTMNKVRKKGRCPKLQMKWVGPLVVEKRLNDVTYQVRITEHDKKVIHYDLLKPYLGRDIPQWVKNFQSRLKTKQ
jgi:transposase InsO family protein